ncbi:MAG: hypothetical protein V2I43_06680, partial [Parvularcula sp.]|nr:hypothetical protein [Parvularcula sp.]
YGTSSAAGKKALAAIDNALSSEAQLIEYLQLLDQDGTWQSGWSWNGSSLTIDFEPGHAVTIENLIASNSFKNELSALKGGAASISIADEEMEAMLSLDPAYADGPAAEVPAYEPIELHIFDAFGINMSEPTTAYFEEALVA